MRGRWWVMTLIDLCKLGLPALLGMAKAGTLRPTHLWTAVEGASKYRDAIANGDVADDLVAQVRAEVHCGQCPSARRVDKAGIQRTFCGEPFENRMNTALPTCGCLVAVTVNGETHPAGKTVVGSEKCPQGKF